MGFASLKRLVGGAAPSLGKGGPSAVANDVGIGSLKLLQIIPGDPPTLQRGLPSDARAPSE